VRSIAAALTVGATIAITPVGAAPAAGSPDALAANCTQSQQTVTCSFTYTGAEQQFTVPADVHAVAVAAVAAAGGGSGPGAGGTAGATVAATPGSTLFVEVGGSAAQGGFNGGGAAGTAVVTGGAGGGGGASDVRTVSCGVTCPGTDASLNSRLVVAGGGGGSGAVGPHAALGAGGSGGRNGAAGANGTAGTDDPSGDAGGGPGLSGKATKGGAFGGGGTAAAGGTDGTDGTAGTPGQGGSGGGGTANTSAGGGGGGWFGGGGGGGGAGRVGDQAGGGGGGGGSSHVPAGGATNVATAGTPGSATRSPADAPADASVTISYSLPEITITAPANGAVYPQTASVPATYSCAEAPPAPAIATCAGPVASGSPIDMTPGHHTFTVTATDTAGDTASQTASYDVVAPPAAAISSPATGGTYTVGQHVPTQFSCTEAANGPGIATCSDSTGASAAPTPPAASKTGTGVLDTSAPGSHTYTVTAMSADGMSTQASIAYTVTTPTTPTLTNVGVSGSTITTGKRGDITFTVDQPATVAFAIAPMLAGTLGTHGAIDGYLGFGKPETSGSRSCTALPTGEGRPSLKAKPAVYADLSFKEPKLFFSAVAPPPSVPTRKQVPKTFPTPPHGLVSEPACRTPGDFLRIAAVSLPAGSHVARWGGAVAARALPAGTYELTAQATTPSGHTSTIATAFLVIKTPTAPKISTFVVTQTKKLLPGSLPTGETSNNDISMVWSDTQASSALLELVKDVPGTSHRGRCTATFSKKLFGKRLSAKLQSIWTSNGDSFPFADVAPLRLPTTAAAGHVCPIGTVKNPILTHLDRPGKRPPNGKLTTCRLQSRCQGQKSPPENVVSWNLTAGDASVADGQYEVNLGVRNAAGQGSSDQAKLVLGRQSNKSGQLSTFCQGHKAACGLIWSPSKNPFPGSLPPE
jgi:hypothetical protein